jgi:hypothetical protein
MDSVFVPQPLSDHRKFYQIMKNKKTDGNAIKEGKAEKGTTKRKQGGTIREHHHAPETLPPWTKRLGDYC